MYPFLGFPNIYNLISRQDIRGLITVFKNTKEYDYKDWNKAYDALIEIGVPAVPYLIEALSDRDIYTRGQAIEILGKIGDKRAVEPLITALNMYHNLPDRGKISEALGKIGDNRAVEPLIKLLEDDFKDHKLLPQDLCCVIKALGKIGDSRAVESLAKELDNDYSAVRDAAVTALGEIGDDQAVGAICSALWYDDSLGVRGTAVGALGKIGSSNAISILIGELSNDEIKFGGMGVGAAKVLGDIGDIRAVEPLIEALHNGSKLCRETAATALGKIGDVSAIDALTETLSDEDSAVRSSASKALKKLKRKLK